MKSDLRYQLHRVDVAIFRLLEERARVVEEMGPIGTRQTPPVDLDDILARHDGTLDAAALRRLATAIDDAFAREES